MDEDLYHTIKLKEYMQLVSPVLKKFEKLIKKSHDYLKGKKFKLHSVEIVGGGSRIPAI
jgi:molecular chaperone DnaK (HSP70)